MIFINHFGNSEAAKDYHGHLSQGDAREYHGAGYEHLPTYQGKAARMLGIEHQPVTKESFFALCDNEHPVTGERITQRTKAERRAMTDVTLDVPKSVSLAAIVDPRVEKAVDEAVNETLRDVERQMHVRVRKNGVNEDRPSGNAIWCVWKHETSRPLKDQTVDPQMHRHATFLNISFDKEEGVYKACQWGNIVRDKGHIQSEYHARLGAKLSVLGYGIEKDGTSFKLKGISRDLCDKFSRRHAVIDKAAEEKGIEDPKGRAALAKSTRNKKGNELGSEALKGEWLDRMTMAEKASLKAAGNGQFKTNQITAEQAVQYAIDHSFERTSTISEKRLKGEALRYAVGSVLPDEIDRAVAKRDLIRKEVNGEAVVTTKEALGQEVKMLSFARDGRGRFGELGNVEHLAHGLSAEQGAAAAMICHSRDRVVGVKGSAGVGKTHMMKAAAEAIEKSGTKVHVFAPSAQAARKVLRDDAGFANAETLERLLVDENMQRQVRGQVIWVDEAGMVGNRDMGRLFEVAQKQNARVVLSGDYKQHGSVRAGDAFRILESEAGVKYASLKQNRRQQNAEYRAAVDAISKGTPEGARDGFNRLDKMGAIVEATGDERHKMLVNDYLQAQRDGKEALIIAPTHAEGERLTASLRKALKAEGRLGKERSIVIRKATNWTEAEKGDVRNYEPGMVVEFYQNAKGGFKRGEAGVVVCSPDGSPSVLRQNGTRVALPKETARFQVFRTSRMAIAEGERIRITQNGRIDKKSVNNGDIYTVAKVDGENIITTDGKAIPKTYGHIEAGYVDTSYASQGKTVDWVFEAVGNESLKAANQQQWYVSTSRAREGVRIYVDSKADVRDAIARSNQRMSAVELVKYDPQKATKERLERNRRLEYARQEVAREVPQQGERRHG